MNAERLHAIAIEIQEELKKTNQVNLVNQLVQHLQNQINQPNQPQHQQNVSNTLKTLMSNLQKAKSNDFPPTWRQILEELGVDKHLGNALLKRIENIFTRNQITPSIALSEIQAIQRELQNFQNAINNLVTSFSTLNIGYDELAEGECELGILVPRDYIKNQLRDFGKELEELNKIFSVFSEIVTGSRPGFEIKQISSTDLSVFLDIAPKIGACIASAIERIISLYKSLLEIKQLYNKMKEKGVPDDNLAGVEEYANSFMEQGIEKLIPELLNDFYKNNDDKRKNELRIELRYSLKKIANRIDRSFNFEVRVKPSEQKEENEQDDTYNKILQASKELTFLKESGEPILSLPEAENDKKEKE